MRIIASRLACCVSLACIASVLPAGAAVAAPGDLDPSFGEGGILRIPIGDHHSEIHDIDVSNKLVSPGRVVAAGQALAQGTANFNLDFAVGSFNRDGSPDGAFGGGDGIVVTPISADDGPDVANAVKRMGDGKILVAGSSVGSGGSLDFTLARYLADGTLDPSFAGDGVQTTDFAGRADVAKDIAIQGDKIVVAGYAALEAGVPGTRFALARYDSSGNLDPTFGSGGTVTTAMGSDAGGTTHSEARGLDVFSDGRLAAAGVAVRDSGEKSAFAVVRYLPGGAPDPDFSNDGIALTYTGRSGHDNVAALGIRIFDTFADDVVVQRDGKIVVAGRGHYSGHGKDFALARYKTNGGLDGSFSGNGKQRTSIGPESIEDNGHALELLGGGKLLLAGSTVTGPHEPGEIGEDSDLALAKYLSDGKLDETFSQDGKVITAITGGEDRGYAVGVQRGPVCCERKFLVAGRAGGANILGGDFVFARYLGGGQQIVVIGTPAGTYRASRLKRFTGSASADAGVRRVDIALFRGAPGLRSAARRRRCRWLRNSRARFKRVRSRRGRCGRRVWLRTRGGRNWKFRLKRRLPKGRYVLYSRVTDRKGKRTRRFSARLGNRVRLRVR